MLLQLSQRGLAARSRSLSARSMSAAGSTGLSFDILDEKQVYQRYLTLYSRSVRFPAVQGQQDIVNQYDVVGHPQAEFQFAVTFPFHSKQQGKAEAQVSILKEYCQGPHEMLWVLPTGGFHRAKHNNRLGCAKAELSEEAYLAGGQWTPLLDPDHPGIAEIKWGMNRFTPFLCIDPEAAVQPGARDPEEFIEVHRIGITQLRQLMISGNMLLPSVSTCFMALDRLASMQLL